jgi:hypothetical protein
MTGLQAVAKRLFWWQEPSDALADPVRFLAQVMVYGTPEDLGEAQLHFPASAFRKVLDDPPPGVSDPRSWAYWHAVFGLSAPPSPPGRRIPR